MKKHISIFVLAVLTFSLFAVGAFASDYVEPNIPQTYYMGYNFTTANPYLHTKRDSYEAMRYMMANTESSKGNLIWHTAPDSTYTDFFYGNKTTVPFQYSDKLVSYSIDHNYDDYFVDLPFPNFRSIIRLGEKDYTLFEYFPDSNLVIVAGSQTMRFELTDRLDVSYYIDRTHNKCYYTLKCGETQISNSFSFVSSGSSTDLPNDRYLYIYFPKSNSEWAINIISPYIVDTPHNSFYDGFDDYFSKGFSSGYSQGFSSGSDSKEEFYKDYISPSKLEADYLKKTVVSENFTPNAVVDSQYTLNSILERDYMLKSERNLIFQEGYDKCVSDYEGAETAVVGVVGGMFDGFVDAFTTLTQGVTLFGFSLHTIFLTIIALAVIAVCCKLFIFK